MEDYRRMRAVLRDRSANAPWQSRMTELLDIEDGYSGEDPGIRLVWELP